MFVMLYGKIKISLLLVDFKRDVYFDWLGEIDVIIEYLKVEEGSNVFYIWFNVRKI